VPGYRCRGQHPLRSRHRGALQAHQHSWRATTPTLGQRTGVRSRAILRWLLAAKIETAHIDPGKPWQNGSDESFNGKFRDECLSLEWFKNRIDAKIVIEDWRRHYNEDRPHSSLAYLTPLQFKQQGSTTNPKAAVL